MSLGLAAPLWLLGLLSLLLPLALHLLARGRGRRVRVGSVRLLTASPARRPRRLHLQRPLLLAARCLLLALLVLALAGPRLRRDAAAAAPARPWVLLEPQVAALATSPDDAPAAPGRTGPAADAAPVPTLPAAVRRAIAGGAEVRLLAPGLPPRRSADASSLPDLADVPGGSWSLLREAAATAPPGTRLLVVSRGRLAALRGERPALANPVDWFELPDPRVNRWVAGRPAAGAGGEILVGTSDAAGTTFAAQAEARPDAAAGGTAGSVAGLAMASLPPGDALAADDRLALPAVRPLRVAVVAAAERQADVRYVRAALAAAAEAAGVPLELVPPAEGEGGGTAVTVADGGRTPALAFWLGDAPPPATLLAAARDGAVLISDAAAREEACDGTFLVPGSSTPVALHRCGDLGGASPATVVATPLWRSETGRAVLLAQPLGGGRWLRFASRFHPAWSDLVLSPAFPEWLRGLLRSTAGVDFTAEVASSDRRAAGGQGRPAAAPPRRAAPTPPPPSRAPEQAAWLLLFPLLLAERWLAARR